MIRASPLIWVVLPALSIPPPALAQDCTLKKIASVKLDATVGKLPVVTAKLNDTDRRLVVDTGSTFSGVDPQVAKELGLTTLPIMGGRELYTNGKQIDHYAKVKRLRVDRAEVTNLALVLMPPRVLPAGTDGLIGADVLSVFDADFDFGQQTLNLMSPKHCKGNVVYWTDAYTTVPFENTDSRQLFVAITLDGKRIRAMIDTGTAQTFISESGAARTFGLDEKSPGVEPIQGAPAGSPWRFKYRFDSLSFEGVAVRHPLIRIHADDNERAFSREHTDRGQSDPLTRVELERADVVVGMNILASLHIYVSYDERTLYISAVNAH